MAKKKETELIHEHHDPRNRVVRFYKKGKKFIIEKEAMGKSAEFGDRKDANALYNEWINETARQ